jgi:hypothetical protein
MQANRLLGDRAVDRAFQDHPAVDGGVFGAGQGRDQDVFEKETEEDMGTPTGSS